MVRKWSYLTTNSSLVGLLPQGLNLSTKNRYNFKVFRNTTRFKRWSVGVTSIVRKRYMRRKHLSNFITLSYITNTWVSFYAKQRGLIRYYQGLKIVGISFISPEKKLVIKKLYDESFVLSGFGALILSPQPKSLRYYNTFRFTSKNPYNFSSNSNLSKVSESLIYSSASADISRTTKECLYAPFQNFDTFQVSTDLSIHDPVLEASKSLHSLSSFAQGFNSSIYNILILTTLLNCGAL